MKFERENESDNWKNNTHYDITDGNGNNFTPKIAKYLETDSKANEQNFNPYLMCFNDA